MLGYDTRYLQEIQNFSASCVWRDGKRIGSYQDSAKTVSTMNCCEFYCFARKR